MSREQVIGHYPFDKAAAPTRVHTEFGRHLGALLELPIFEYQDRQKLFDYVSAHFMAAEELFGPEEDARNQCVPRAYLFYHSKEHAVYQASYDAVTTTAQILERSPVAKYLTVEGALSIVIAAAHHDDGYVYEAPEGSNYVVREPIHVAQGIRAATHFLDEILTPSGLSSTKLKRLVPIGIHATSFPFDDEQRRERAAMLKDLDAKDKKEALIVALSVQLADFGGQVARNDYIQNLRDLRAEFNCRVEGLGDQVIGKDSEMGEKCKVFIEEVVQRSVGKTATAFFGTNNNTFAVQWQKHTR